MKAIGVVILSSFLLLMHITGFVSAQDDFKGIQSPNSSNHAVYPSDTKNTPPDLFKGNAEKKGKDQNDTFQQETAANALTNAEHDLREGKDKPLEEPKTSRDFSKQILDGESNPAKDCDPSSICIDEKTKLVACLRVPGTDAQALSLVIQNKGKVSLSVKIISPFLNLEHTYLQIVAKEDKEVKVYINEGSAKDSLIILQAGGDNCSLDLRNIISNSVSKTETLSMPRFISISRGFALLFIFLAVAIIAGIAWLCIKFRPFFPQEAGTKYQKVEVGLPVSSGGKKEADNGDDMWDTNWGNGWDEEEAPMTPSKVISNPSLKGLASRRFNKDGWKD